MSALQIPEKVKSIAGLQVRRNWRGKQILQVRRNVVRAKYLTRPGKKIKYEFIRFTDWKDANANDLSEVYEILNKLNSNIKTKKNELE